MDKVDPAVRSRNMAAVHSKNTSPERAVRSWLHARGYRFRLHRKVLPGTPDIAFPGRRKVIFVHGCFWHSHPGCRRASRPTTNSDFWHKKIDRNVERDEQAAVELTKLGWKVLVVWECELRGRDDLQRKLRRFLGAPGKTSDFRVLQPVKRRE